MGQIYADSLPDYPAECSRWMDLGWRIVPYLGVTWFSGTDLNSLADIWIIVSLVSFFAIVLFVFYRPQLIVRRFLFIYSAVFAFRALTVMATGYARLPYRSDPFRPTNPAWGALLIMAGVRTTAKDLMFSGHTAGWILTASMISRYSHHTVLSVMYWLFNIAGILVLDGVREHTTADILVAVLITRLAYSNYHLWLDSEHIRFWRPGIEVTALQPADLFLPLHVVDAVGARYSVGTLPTDELVVPMATTRDTLVHDSRADFTAAKLVAETWYYATWARFRVYYFFHWLDGE